MTPCTAAVRGRPWELPEDEAPQGCPRARYAMRRVFERMQAWAVGGLGGFHGFLMDSCFEGAIKG